MSCIYNINKSYAKHFCDLLSWGDFNSYQLFFNYSPNKLNIFIDCAISGFFGLLATTGGLFRVGNGKRVNTAMNESDVSWILVTIPEGINAPIQLLSVSQTGRHQDVAQGIGGNIYVFSAHVGVDQSRVHRFSVQTIDENPMQEDTIQLFNELLRKFSVAF